MSDLIDRLLILRSPGIGPVGYNKLIKQYGSVEAVADTLRGNSGLMDSVLYEIDSANALGIKFICDDSEYYPVSLKNVKGHPPIICVRGNLETLKQPMVSIVGTRHATAAGMKFVSDIAMAFANHSVVVVSGMAIGTDTAAHRGTLRVDGNTQTVAVLGGGVDYIWPLENESLYWEIIERGAVISEMPVGFVPRTTNFVQRNRWIAGMGSKLILSEADLKSGSMTTARFAYDFNREIWAVPSHPSDPRSAGPNSLIASNKAKLCSGVENFFDKDKKTLKTESLDTKTSESESILLDALGTVPVSESVLADIVKKNVSEIKRDLVVLELRGLVQKQDGGYTKI